jgi:PAS domain S-box-containing protein
VRRAFDGDVVALPPVFYDASAIEGGGRRSWTQGHFFPMRDGDGAVTGVVLVHVDLTERMDADEARRQSEERLRVALDAGRMGAWEWDVAGGRVHWSDTLQRIHGLVPGTFGGTFDESQADIHPDDRDRVLAQMAHSLEGGAHQLEYRIVPPGGEVRWLEARGELFRDADGRPSRMLGVCMDVTERKHAEAERDAAQRRLEEQAAELAAQTEQLQTQAAELEERQAELEVQTEELQVTNEELHQTNEALAAARTAAEHAEAYTRGILGSIGDPFVVHDHEWRFRYVNAAAAAIFARSDVPNAEAPDAMLGRVVWEAYPELAGTAYEREMRRARDEGVVVTFTEFHAASGTWSEMRCYPMPGRGLATLWRDVTEQKRAEEARHYLARASEILVGSLDRDETARQIAGLLVPRLADWCSIQLLDGDGELRQLAVAHVDPAKVAWAAALNERYPADPEARTGAHEVVRTGQPILLADIPDALLVAAAQDEEHLRILREIGFASALTVPLVARDQVLGAMSLVSAESGRRYTDAELALAQELATRAALAIDNAALYGAAVRAREEAEAANRAKADFLATMSHELRTPLNAIGGYAQLIEMGVHGPVTAAQGEALSRVQRSQQHLLSLINDVLNFAKLEAGRVTYDIERVGVRELLAGLEPLVAPQLAAKALRFACAPCETTLAAAADAEKARQILLNLLSNAIKFTAGRAARSASRRARTPTGCAWACRTPASASRPTAPRRCSSRSCSSRAAPRPGGTGRDSGWRSAATWRAPWGATSRSRARRGWEHLHAQPAPASRRRGALDDGVSPGPVARPGRAGERRTSGVGGACAAAPTASLPPHWPRGCVGDPYGYDRVRRRARRPPRARSLATPCTPASPPARPSPPPCSLRPPVSSTPSSRASSTRSAPRSPASSTGRCRTPVRSRSTSSTSSPRSSAPASPAATRSSAAAPPSGGWGA